MTEYQVQEWPDMPGDGGGDAIVFSSEWPADEWRRFKSYYEAWGWVMDDAVGGDTITVLEPHHGRRNDDGPPWLT
jgi:hypothetical protein